MSKNKISAIIVDIDGTIALHNGRSPFDFNKIPEDLPNEPIINIVWWAQEDRKYVILLTGREEKYREQTISWLDKYEVPYDSLLMRSTNDTRQDTIVKKEIYHRDIEPKYDIQFALEDRLRVAKMWHELGITVLRVGDPEANY